MNRFMVFCMFAAVLTVSCEKDSSTKEIDNMEIQTYIADNNLDAQSTSSGLHYTIDKEGNGQHPNLNNEVTVHYRGYYTDGEQFDSSYDRGMPATFPLSMVIEGWQEGIPFFSKGGKGKLLIPSHLGYGSGPPPGIRPNAVLVFDIELITF